jgi:starch synthase
VRVLFVTSELFPLVKTGGLADVSHALPRALGALGVEAKVVLPAYPGVLERLDSIATVVAIDDLFGGPARLLAGRIMKTEILAIDAPHLFSRSVGGPYLAPDGHDWPDNARRFAALGWVASEIALGRLLDWRPDVLHAHDWQAGLAPAYLALSGTMAPASILTIHNITFQGLFPASLLGELRLPRSSFAIEGVEFHGQVGFLKAGLYFADRITTVSPTHALEIQTAQQGMGLHGLLRHRARDLSGILNGVDEEIWNPARDPHIAAPYCDADLSGKAANKAALQRRLGLKQDAAGPLFCVVSRMSYQKGLDLLLAALPELLSSDSQLALLGTGDSELEAAFRASAAGAPSRIACTTMYDEEFSHLFQAGADAIVVPSRFEPCGLTQLYGLRYGTLPIVSCVGGLADTVIDASEAALRDGVATGFQFAPPGHSTLGMALSRAVDLFTQRKLWQNVQRRAMTRDVSWKRSAQGYASLYRTVARQSRDRLSGNAFATRRDCSR